MICKKCLRDMPKLKAKGLCTKCYMNQYNKQYYLKNRDKIKEETKKYRIKHSDKQYEWHRQWKINNREHISEYNKKWNSSSVASIYEITNLISGKKYIGSTTMNPKERWHKHITAVKRYPHHSLYSDMVKFGRENFKFEVLFTCSKDQARLAEQFVMDAYGKELYNKRKAKRRKTNGL